MIDPYIDLLIKRIEFDHFGRASGQAYLYYLTHALKYTQEEAEQILAQKITRLLIDGPDK